MTEIAWRTGLTRESLYRSRREGARPEFSTISKVARACGIDLVAVPARARELEPKQI